ncbi:GNAT superfamily N-acetyltransferase [Pelomonas saccharophila]|uniref:GNAT superfamily N-acetyltransferase n=1 Tax=Roseateles saccharophilus TaxID=304 RepID=A0ABU1YKG8_ROSSA|nr:GNAT family N-acetyltransferase [Roseateles saccharophilus]MDR7269356.1 GNAT superfamily N-acetyltransferase [Roseateles saccharophilus]
MKLDTLLAAWGRGWSATRGTPAPEALGDGAWRIAVGLPGHRVRDLLPDWPAARLQAWAAAAERPGAWVKALIDPAALVLAPAWQRHAPEYLMSAALQDAAAPPLAAGYRAELRQQGDKLECRVLAADGEPAARALVGLTGRHAIFDQVVTEAAHRRLGLGRHAMARLTEAARACGADTGLLVATEEGRALYTALGWQVDSPMAAASVAEAA